MATTYVISTEQLNDTLARISEYVSELNGQGIKTVTTSANGLQMLFWTSNDTTGTPAVTVDFPEEMFLDQTRTEFVQNFNWSNATYPGSTNPNLNGKPVLVLAVKGDKSTNPYLSYSFVNLETLIKTYTPADETININGTEIGVNVSAATGNNIEVKNDGIYASPKVDSAVQGNFATFGASGAVVDSGVTFASDEAITAMLNRYFPTNS